MALAVQPGSPGNDLQLGIRTASAADAVAISHLVAELGFPATPEDIARRMNGLQSPALVAVLDGKIVGVAATSIMHVIHRPHPVGRISALVVAAEHRGRGIGRALVHAVEELLRRHGCGLLEVTSNLALERAHAFYARLGFEKSSHRFRKSLVDAGN